MSAKGQRQQDADTLAALGQLSRSAQWPEALALQALVMRRLQPAEPKSQTLSLVPSESPVEVAEAAASDLDAQAV